MYRLKKFLFAVMMGGFCAALWGHPVFAEEGFMDVSVTEANAIIQDTKNNPDLIILDVRTSEEFNAGHLNNAINLDVNSDKFRDQAGKLDKNKKYLVYCRSGKRSKTAQGTLKEMGFKEVMNMTGGFLEWEKAGLPFKK